VARQVDPWTAAQLSKGTGKRCLSLFPSLSWASNLSLVPNGGCTKSEWGLSIVSSYPLCCFLREGSHFAMRITYGKSLPETAKVPGNSDCLYLSASASTDLKWRPDPAQAFPRKIARNGSDQLRCGAQRRIVVVTRCGF
jgi:hypothetical protein